MLIEYTQNKDNKDK